MIGFYSCFILAVFFAMLGLLFGIFKEKAARFISGFNSLPKYEQDLYDKAFLVRDMRNSCFLWAGVMLAGAAASLISPYCAIIAYIIWGILFLKEVHLDAHKAFEKYLRK